MSDWVFWVAAAGMSLAVAASLIAVLFQRRDAEPAASSYDMQVYRAQLAEVGRDVASGMVSSAEAERLKAEISRRILEADKLGRGVVTAGTARGPWLAGAVILVMLGATVWGYLVLGAPGYPDVPLQDRLAAAERFSASRPSQAKAEAVAQPPAATTPDPDMAALMIRLRQAVADRPGDVQGLQLLVQNEAALGNLAAARDAMVALIAAKPVPSGADHARLAELMIGLTGGYVSPEAEAELITALKLEPANGTALYYSGLMFAQGDRADRAFAIWRDLLAASAPDDPWVAPINAQIADLAARAGIRYNAPDAAGPTQDQIDAAGAMSPKERMAMIQTMVDGLSERLASKGGPVEDWARLITSLAVLGDKDQALAIYTEGQTAFIGRDDALGTLKAAAQKAGIIE